MSGAVQSLAWAMSIRGLDASSFRVLIALVNRANHRTGECFPSHQCIADDAEMSVATVKRVIAKLVERELLTVVNQMRDNGGKSANRYRLAIAQNEPSTIAQNELSPSLTGELCNRTRNKEHTSRAKALSVRAKLSIEQAFPDGPPSDKWAADAVAKYGWRMSDAKLEVERFIESAKAHGREYLNWNSAWATWRISPFCKTTAADDGWAFMREPLRG